MLELRFAYDEVMTELDWIKVTDHGPSAWSRMTIGPSSLSEYDDHAWCDSSSISVSFGKTQDLISSRESFIYPIAFRHYAGFDGTLDPKLFCSRFSWIPKEIRRAARDGRCTLLLDDRWECFYAQGERARVVYDHLYSLVDFLGIPSSTIIYLTSNLRAAEELSVAEDLNGRSGLQVVVGDWFSRESVRICERQIDTYCACPRPHKLFLCLNRHFNHYRQYLVLELERAGILDEGLVSLARDDAAVHMLNPEYYIPWGGDHDELAASAKRLVPRLPLITDLPDFSINQVEVASTSLYDETLLSLVTETTCDPSFLFVTEKVYKTMIMQHPFMIMGSPGTLKYLRSQGFKTFSEFWDESYDEERDPRTKALMIISELKRLSALSYDERVQLACDVRMITEHNKQQVIGGTGKYAMQLAAQLRR